MSVVRVEAVVLWALPRWGADDGAWDEAWADIARLRSIHVSGLGGIRPVSIDRPSTRNKPHRGQHERAEHS